MPLLTLVPIIGCILFVRRCFDMRTASAAIHAVSIMLVTLYLAALAGVLLAAAATLLFAGTMLALYEGSLLIRSKTVVPGIGVLVLLCSVFWLLHFGGKFAYYDEYAHWGIYIKDMLLTHQLWGTESNAMHLRYLPGPPLWQYLFLLPGGFSDGGAYLAQFFLLLLPLLVLWEGLERRQIGWMLGVVALLVVALANFGHGVASLYVDHVVAAWFAGIVFSFMLDVRDRTSVQLLSYALPLAALVLLKDAALYFAIVAMGIMAGLLLGCRWSGGQDPTKLRRFGVATGVAILWLAAGLAVTATWSANRVVTDTPQATISLAGILRGIASGETNLSAEEQAELGRRYVDVLLNHQISKNETSAMYNAFSYQTMPQFTDRFRLTTASALLLFVFWMGIAMRWLVAPGDRWRWGLVAAGLCLATLVYLLVLYLSYRFAFGDRALSLSSFTRYAHTALLPMLLFVFLPLLPGFSDPASRQIKLGDTKLNRSAAIFGALLLVLYVYETPHVTPLVKAGDPPPVREQLAPLTVKVSEVVGDKRLWIYFPIPDSNGLYGRILRFLMAPVRTDVAVNPVLLQENPWALYEAASEFDYLWFPMRHAQMDEVLANVAAGEFGDNLFRVDRVNGEMNLVPLPDVFE